MVVQAFVNSRFNQHDCRVETDGSEKVVSVAPKSTGWGSSLNGGELLMLSLATCFCNDLYREAAKMNIQVSEVEVSVSGEFGAAGEPGTNFTYSARVESESPKSEIDKLIRHTDSVAEIHNTLRKGISVELV